MLTLRHTELDLLQRCPRQYEFFRTVGPLPPGAALHFGSSYHEGQRAAFTGKVATGEYNLLEASDAYSDYFDKYKEFEVVFGEDEKPGPMKDLGFKLLALYAGELAPSVMPKEVEATRETLALPDCTLRGRLDLITLDDDIIDHKTTSRLPSERDLANDIQVNTYFLLDPSAEEFHFHYAHKTKLAVFDKATSRTAKEQDWFVRVLLTRYVEMIKAGIFPPSIEGWWCSPAWCGWFPICGR